MRPCTVVVKNESRQREDVTYARKPQQGLLAVPIGCKPSQIVRPASPTHVDRFVVLDAETGLPVSLIGMSIFLTIYANKGGDVEVASVKGKVNREAEGEVGFMVNDLTEGFYYYDVSVKGSKGFNKVIVAGSYVVKN